MRHMSLPKDYSCLFALKSYNDPPTLNGLLCWDGMTPKQDGVAALVRSKHMSVGVRVAISTEQKPDSHGDPPNELCSFGFLQT